MQIGEIIRRARPKVCTRHTSGHRYSNTLSNDTFVPAGPSKTGQSHRSPATTPNWMPHTDKVLSNTNRTAGSLQQGIQTPGSTSAPQHTESPAGVPPSSQIVGGAQQFPAVFTATSQSYFAISAAVGDALNATSGFYQTSLFSPDASDTCSSWNLSPYPPLLDMTKPPTFIHQSGTFAKPMDLRCAPDASPGMRLNHTWHPRSRKLRQRVPHVSHFSISEVSHSSKQTSGAPSPDLRGSTPPLTPTPENSMPASDQSGSRLHNQPLTKPILTGVRGQMHEDETGFKQVMFQTLCVVLQSSEA